MKKIHTGLYLVLLMIVGCAGPKQDGLVYFNDFESVKGWAPIYLSRWPVHSGRLSNKLDSNHAYGLSFWLPFSQVSPKKLKAVKISAWVYLTVRCDAFLAMEIKTPDNKSLVWNGVNVDEQVKEVGKWQQVTAMFSLRNKDFNVPDNFINIYTWDKGKKDVYIDDLSIEFIEEQ
ncbi:MAG TPA: hypothetical protein VK809_07445 [Bacteroidia bacterium]|jgi:hypothetical protein|nr:hypothetical protein [Bacteroidia bacterium]